MFQNESWHKLYWQTHHSNYTDITFTTITRLCEQQGLKQSVACMWCRHGFGLFPFIMYSIADHAPYPSILWFCAEPRHVCIVHYKLDSVLCPERGINAVSIDFQQELVAAGPCQRPFLVRINRRTCTEKAEQQLQYVPWTHWLLCERGLSHWPLSPKPLSCHNLSCHLSHFHQLVNNMLHD